MNTEYRESRRTEALGQRSYREGSVQKVTAAGCLLVHFQEANDWRDGRDKVPFAVKRFDLGQVIHLSTPPQVSLVFDKSGPFYITESPTQC